jgi:TPR repeat protein
MLAMATADEHSDVWRNERETLLKNAADHHFAWAAYVLGQEAYDRATGTPEFTPEDVILYRQRTRETFEWYLRGARDGNVLAKKRVALDYLHAFGVERDVVEGLKWAREAADDGLSMDDDSNRFSLGAELAVRLKLSDKSCGLDATCQALHQVVDARYDDDYFKARTSELRIPDADRCTVAHTEPGSKYSPELICHWTANAVSIDAFDTFVREALRDLPGWSATKDFSRKRGRTSYQVNLHPDFDRADRGIQIEFVENSASDDPMDVTVYPRIYTEP